MRDVRREPFCERAAQPFLVRSVQTSANSRTGGSEKRGLRRRCARGERRARLLSFGPLLKVREEALDEGRVLNARNHLELAAAAPTRLNIDCEHAFEPVHPRHDPGAATHADRGQGLVRYRLKTAYRDGTTDIVLEPLDFLARLAALVPPPWMHLTRLCSAPHSLVYAE